MKRTGGIAMKTWRLVCSLLLAAILTGSAHAVIIKLGTIAPLRSPWVKELKLLGAEWAKITNGAVTVKIYAGGIAGSEDDMVRKIRMGILGGAVFTNIGITHIHPDVYALNIPFFLDSEEELDYILANMKPYFEKEIENKGFKVIAWSKAGWIYFFSKHPVLYPQDLKKHKLSFSTGSPEWEQAWKQSGFHVVPNELKDLMMALQSGMVDAFYLSPLLAASGQYFPAAPNMCPLKIAPLMGGMVFSKKIWDRIPGQYKEKMLALAREMANRLYQETIELEKEAVEEMKKHGLKINPVPADALAKWRASSSKGMDALIDKAFSNDVYERLKKHLEEFRQKRPDKD
jgi:TRAP-type C4-dicarboxylate transport system substrate-binding protein